jgi:hypothetical protein
MTCSAKVPKLLALRMYSRIGWSRFERAVWHGIAADIMVKEKS